MFSEGDESFLSHYQGLLMEVLLHTTL